MTFALTSFAVACASNEPSAVAPIASPTASSSPSATARPSASSPPRSGARLVTSPCVLHSGSANTSRRRDVVHASCTFDAECIAEHGKATGGDGFVAVACEDADCRCEWSVARSEVTIRSTFTIDAPPMASDACKRLLVERCMIDMHLVANAPGAP